MSVSKEVLLLCVSHLAMFPSDFYVPSKGTACDVFILCHNGQRARVRMRRGVCAGWVGTREVVTAHRVSIGLCGGPCSAVYLLLFVLWRRGHGRLSNHGLVMMCEV